jgi:hypothetical protein
MSGEERTKQATATNGVNPQQQQALDGGRFTIIDERRKDDMDVSEDDLDENGWVHVESIYIKIYRLFVDVRSADDSQRRYWR